VIVLDTGGLYAALDANEDLHGRCVAALASAQSPRLLSPFVLADLDYLIGARVGHAAQMALLDEVVRGAYRLEPFSAEDVERATRIVQRYEDLSVGLTDASVVVLAHRHATLDLLCTDQRHFRTLKGPGNKPFRLPPFDA
jgi:hypothetical protein